jgi:hypothetical protein
MGQFVMVGTSWIQGECSIIEGETIALFEAKKEMEQRDYIKVIFETDSKSVVDTTYMLVTHNLAP